MKIQSSIFVLLFVFFATSCELKTKAYYVTIIYTNGEQENIKMVAPEKPRVDKRGCVYNHEEHSYLCGVRKIIVTE